MKRTDRLGTIIHLGGSVEGVLEMFESIPSERRTARQEQIVEDLRRRLAAGITSWTTCPTPIEVAPGVFKCPGHQEPYEDPIEEDESEKEEISLTEEGS